MNDKYENHVEILTSYTVMSCIVLSHRYFAVEFKTLSDMSNHVDNFPSHSEAEHIVRTTHRGPKRKHKCDTFSDEFAVPLPPTIGRSCPSKRVKEGMQQILLKTFPPYVNSC